MPLSLNELIKKAKDRGINSAPINSALAPQPLRPWQQESTLFSIYNKPTTNRQHENNGSTETDNKVAAQPATQIATNRQQIDNKQATKRQHENNGSTETDNKVAAQPAAQIATNRQQTDNKPITNLPFSSLVGIQRALIIFIYNECNIARSKSTKNLTLEHISKTVKTSIGCIKTTLQRLEAKAFVKRIEYKNGRGGWSRYSISDQLFQEILQYETNNKLTTKWQQTDNKVIAQPATQPTTIFSSSGSYNVNKETTTTETIQYKLLPEWQNFDLEPLNKIGFTTNHLSQIANQNKLQPQAVQDSIYAFAFDLQENDKAKSIKGDPINYFMGILRNGRVYTFPSNYESPQDKALRIYADQRRVIEQKKKLIEKESLDLAFGEWFGQLTEAQKKAFLPENIQNIKIAFGKNKIIENAARSHFEAEIWPDKKQKIIKSTINQDQDLQNQIPTNIEQEVSNVENN